MWQIKRLVLTIPVLPLLVLSSVAHMPRVIADTTSAPSLVVSQLKITSSNGQFITLFNATSTVLDMSKYQLQYFNHYDLTKATSSKLISLHGMLQPHSYYMVNDSSLLLCYRLTVDSLSLGLSSTTGLVQVLGLQQSQPGSSALPVLHDYVAWSKTVAAGAQTLPANAAAFLLRQPLDDDDNPFIESPGTGLWQTVQPDPSNACGLVSGVGVPVAIDTGLTQLLPSSEPPATIVSLSSLGDGEIAEPLPSLPAADIGLMAPRITEVLPNPDGTGNDATDEYIELHNPNQASFDLTGFSLNTGMASLRTYNFPTGTMLAPNSFTAFYSEATSLSLSNTTSRAIFRDPFGNALSATDTYANAKDSQAWALANGKWYWTTSLTPNAANVIKQPVVTKKKTATKAKTPSAAAAKAAKPAANTAAVAKSSEDDVPTTPIHLWTLALVASAAVLYGAYEYRTDLTNRIYRLRQHLTARRADRFKAAGRRGDRASK